MIMQANVPAGIEEINARLTGLFAVLRAQAARWLRPAGVVLVGETRTTLSRPGTGRWYKSRGIASRLGRKGTKKRAKQMHQASAPGDPPAVDVGELRRSIGIDENGATIRVGTPLRYAPALEFGTKSRGAMLARSLRGRTGPGVDRRGLAARLRRASAPRSLTQSVAQRGSGRLDPRPFLRPSLERAQPKMAAAVIAEIEVLAATHFGGR